MMITCHWQTEETMEIWSGINLQAKGKLIIRVYKASRDFHNTNITISDPFQIPIFVEIIPKIIEGEYWQVSIPLTHYFHEGKYIIRVDGEKELFLFEFYLESRKNEQQTFSAETKIVAKNLQKRTKSFSFQLPNLPSNILLQTTGKQLIRGANLEGRNIEVDNLMGKTQKTISWLLPIQPSHLPVDVHTLEDQPDEFYVFNQVNHQSEPGLEINLIDLNTYKGTLETHYPIKLITDILNHIHRNMRYVRQSKERGVGYALKYGRGDCTEYSAFFVTLARKLGLKARLVSGMSRSFHNNWIAHAFAEVYIYGTWVPLDVVKPPKPYLQLGNRGELIGFSRSNWLSPDKKDYKFQFMAVKGTKPQIEINQKVTESGVQKLPKNYNREPRKRLIDHIWKKYKEDLVIDKYRKWISIANIKERITSIILVDGSLSYGRIVHMQNVPEGSTEIKITSQIPSKGRVALLDMQGNLRGVYHIV